MPILAKLALRESLPRYHSRLTASQTDLRLGAFMTMSENLKKEHLGYVFVRAVAYAGGFSCYRPEVDDDSVDIGIAMRGANGTVRSPRLDVQVKCTGAGMFEKSETGYQLTLKNYDDLRYDDFQVPRILVVVLVPSTGAPTDWLKQTDQQLSLKHCGYWLSLRGQPPYSGSGTVDPTVTVHLRKKQKFDVAALTAMMDRIAGGGLP